MKHVPLKHHSFRCFSNDVTNYYNSKSFRKIPSPKSLPLIGHAYLFSKNGPYSAERFTEAVEDLSCRHGPIFRLKFPNQSFVITTDAENAFKLFQHEGKFPNRIELPALALYQKRTYDAVGIISQNGFNWYKLRKTLSQLLSKTYLAQFSAQNEEVASNFAKYIRSQRDDKDVVSDLCRHLFKYSAQSMSGICPGASIKSTEVMERIIEGTSTFMDGLYRTYSEVPVWKFMNTKGYKKLESGHKVITEFMDKEISKPESEWRDSFMKHLFQNKSLTRSEARVLSTEVFLSGIDSVSTTIAMTLFYLSRHKNCQDLAFDDIEKNSISYLRACVKETLRLSPTAGGTTRALPIDVIMNGYKIPANTNITVFHSVTSRMEKYFDNAKMFNPERWLKEGGLSKKEEYSRYASMPFGHGLRVCPGRWLSEQEIIILLKKVLKEFTLECATPSDVGMIFRMNRIPDKPINIKFVDRNTKQP